LLVGPFQDWRGPALASFDDVWQTINDSFHDPSFGGLDWTGIRSELRPKAEAAHSAESVRAVIRDMLARLRQSHFELLSADSVEGPLGAATVPISVRVTADDVVITGVVAASTADRAGLRAGQVLVTVDGKPAAGWAASGPGETDGRVRAHHLYRRAIQALHGSPGSVAEIGVREVNGRQRTVRVTRVAESGQAVTLGNLPPLHVTFEDREVRSPGRRRVGVIAFNLWMTTIAGSIETAVERYRRADGFVIDLRGNPGGLASMLSGVAGHFIDKPLLLGTMHTRDAQLSFKVNPRVVMSDGRSVEPFSGPVAILVDELTGSASECFAGALQSLGRARVFGRLTMGQALPSVTRRLPNGDVLIYALGDFVTATGRRLEGAGVEPDTLVPLSLEDLARGGDATLTAALRWIDTQKR
jgi:carboxyl-terminal processing protease